MNLADKTEVSGLTFDNKPVIALNDLQLAERREYLSRLGTGQYVEQTVEACHYVLVTRILASCFNGQIRASGQNGRLPELRTGFHGQSA